MKEKLPLLVTLFLASALRVYLVVRNSVPFAYDMGRDLLWAKDIAFYHIPTLIGPAASIWGVYFGPLWFYFLAVPLLITGGHPLSVVYLTAFTIVLTGVLGYLLFKKYLSGIYALTFAAILLFSFTLVNISTFAFHANLLPLLTLLMIYFCFLAVVKKPIFIAATFLAVSLMFHADPAPAVVMTAVPAVIFLFFKLYRLKSWPKAVLLSTFAYIIPFVPQIIFEIRNNFVEGKSLIAYFRGQNPSLSGKLPLFDRIINRLNLFFDFFKASFAGGNTIFAVILILFVVLGIYFFWKSEKNQNLRALFKINLASLLLTFLILTLLITVEVKNWYLFGTTIFFAIFLTLALYSLRKVKIILPLFLAFYLILNVTPFFINQSAAKSRSDPATLSNQLKVIDLIYTDSQNRPFAVYVFTPSIYDLNWQYLFWWQGEKLKRGLPADFAYLPNQPAYVRNKQVYAPTTGTFDTIYLIIENAKENEFYTKANWLANFADYKVVFERNINRAITVQKRLK